ncbi:MAG: GNAT family N-acetyltransferase [Oscillospiraceae bacterium]|nr:GNAT family N-acetyltransferase [Oscillospiraceae bacterium]
MDITIKTGAENMQLPAVCALLHATYWANDRPDEVVEKSLQKSDCVGAFLVEEDKQIGFARLITDDAVLFYLCDVVVDEKYRGHGVGRKMMETVLNNEKYKQMLGLLGTEYAHGFYEKCGFLKSTSDGHYYKPKGV